MSSTNTPQPHGGALKNIIVDAERAAILKELSFSLPDITLSDHHMCDLELIATGALSPLEGFMVQADYESVIDRMRLQDDTLWPIPVTLDISKNKANGMEAGQSAALRDPEGFLLAVMHIEDIWKPDKEREAQGVFNFTEAVHPGVRHLFNEVKEYYVGGRIEVISLPLHYDFKKLRQTPLEVRSACRKFGWQRMVGYQTSSVMHRQQFEITLEAMRRAKANLLLLPVVGVIRTEEFDYYTRVRCNQKVMRHYPPDTHILSLLPHFLRMAGPREAILNAIIAKNYGCTHFMVSHDHADPCIGRNNGCSYNGAETGSIIEKCKDDLGIPILRFEQMVYLSLEDEHRFINKVPKNSRTIQMNGSDIRARIRTGRKVPGWASFPEVLDELRKAYPPPSQQGFTVFCTGLSGAGKSTVAKVLFSKMLEIGQRPVTLLDGDIVRHNLSSELTFSKEHRDINVRRIGFVATEITKNRGIAICAPIAPYERTRLEIRQAIEAHGGFIEIHVATPLHECEKRDRKGMYAKARAGLIKGYTGIDDPYEAPKAPELYIDTTDITPDEAAQEILLYLGQKGYI
jgi:sulfate adenylyltransferase